MHKYPSINTQIIKHNFIWNIFFYTEIMLYRQYHAIDKTLSILHSSCILSFTQSSQIQLSIQWVLLSITHLGGMPFTTTASTSRVTGIRNTEQTLLLKQGQVNWALGCCQCISTFSLSHPFKNKNKLFLQDAPLTLPPTTEIQKGLS